MLIFINTYFTFFIALNKFKYIYMLIFIGRIKSNQLSWFWIQIHLHVNLYQMMQLLGRVRKVFKYIYMLIFIIVMTVVGIWLSLFKYIYMLIFIPDRHVLWSQHSLIQIHLHVNLYLYAAGVYHGRYTHSNTSTC